MIILKINYLKRTCHSIKRLEQLGNKNYHDLVPNRKPGFFVCWPYRTSFCHGRMKIRVYTTKHSEKNIVIVTPATLLATLRTIDSMWTNQSNKKTRIARQASVALYGNLKVLWQI
jgi:DNA recombination protein RmuC